MDNPSLKDYNKKLEEHILESKLYNTLISRFENLKKENQQLKWEVENLNQELKRKNKYNENLKEEIESQKIMFAQTGQYLNDIITEIESQKQEIEQKNDEIIKQRDTLKNFTTTLQERNQEIEMQKSYLQAMVKDLEANNQEIEMQKNYLQVLVGDLEESNIKIKKQKADLKVTIKALKKKLEVEKEKNLLQQAFNELDIAYKDIVSSISYAKRIQDSMLPKHNLLELYFEDFFIFFKPKNIVSGDFYWFKKENNKFIITAVDCTGHGVPGALMSILGMNLLKEIVTNRKNTSPEKILKFLDIDINYLLNQNHNNNRDGMDAAICTIDFENKLLEYAGAHNPLLFIQDNKTQVIKGNRFGVGGYDFKKENLFTKHAIKLDKPTTIYIYSDGYQDQFGEKTRRKFMSKRFRNLLFEIHHKPMKDQEQILKSTLEEWKGNQSQIDDILIMGLKINLT